MPFLVEREHTGREPAATRVEGEVLRIGRGTNAELRLDGEAVALEHARIERDPAGCKLVDLGSVTGTYRNGKPVEEAYLADGDVLGVGGWLLRVRWPAPAEPLALEVRPVAGETPMATAATPVEAPEIDFAGAYTLRRPFLTKGSLAFFLTLAAGAAAITLPLTGAWRAFQPGGTSAKHQRQEVGCFDCHVPWRGPATAACSECHPRGGHQARQASTPGCADCHFEHRGKEKLIAVGDASCVACHGGLKVAGDGEPAFAREITDFPQGHADFSVTLAAGRIPVAEAVARQADPGGVRLNHALHLKPGLIGREGRETLTCASCHQPGPGPTGLQPVEYEQHCQRCHRLTFDDARPDEEAPHSEPREVHSALVAVYQVDEGRLGSLRERRRIGVRTPRAAQGLDLSARTRAQVLAAENHLFRGECATCHEVDLGARPFPAVAPARLQGQWLPLSHFKHGRHTDIAGLTCATCHPRAAASTATADVLLPGIEACGGCHGGGEPPGEAERKAGRDECAGCHSYHPPKTGPSRLPRAGERNIGDGNGWTAARGGPDRAGDEPTREGRRSARDGRGPARGSRRPRREARRPTRDGRRPTRGSSVPDRGSGVPTRG